MKQERTKKAVAVGLARGVLTAEAGGNACPVHDPLEGVVLYLDDGAAPAALIALDLGGMPYARAARVREEIGAACGLPAEAVILHYTHTHTGAGREELEGLGERLVGLVQQAQGSARPAQLAYAEQDTEGRLNLNRRQALPCGLGNLTTFMGMVDCNGRPDGGPQNRLRLEQWRGFPPTEAELQGPMIYEGPVDSLVQGLFFRTPEGEPIGSLVRFACHVTPANHAPERLQSADFPAVTRERMRAAHGGECLYLTGPCGNIAPWERGDWVFPEPTPETPEEFNPGVMWAIHQRDPKAAWEEVRRIGMAIAEALLAQSPPAEAYAPLTSLRLAGDSPRLPLRTDLPESAEEIQRLRVEAAAEFLRERASLPLPELKALADRVCRLHLASHRHRSRDGEDTVPVDLPVLCLNEVLVMGFPGETFWETAQPAREAALARGWRYVSFTLANGSVGYIPTEAERPLGDYEVHGSALADGAEAKLGKAAEELVRRVVGE